MLQSALVAILIVSEHAEFVKLVTVSLRGFFPSCRVDVAYSAEEARAWASSHEWNLILLDEQCLAEDPTSLPRELKRRTPYTGIILHSDRSDSASALQALQADVDFFLSNKSPAFLTELLFCATEAIEKYHLRMALDHAHERHRRLIESLSDIVYELDANGCFVAISPGIVTLLGYTPDELIGLPYTTLVPPDLGSVAQYRLNERRSGARGTSRLELTLKGKLTRDKTPLTLTAEVNARGLYDPLRRFLGTVGLIRDLSQPKQQDRTINQLRQQLQHTDERLVLAQRVTLLSQQLHDSLASLPTQSQQLLTTLRDARLDDQAQTIASHAVEATKLGAELAQALQEREDGVLGYTINELLDAILTSSTEAIVDSAGFIRQCSPHLPPLTGDREQTTKLMHSLLNYAQTYVQAVGRSHRLIVSTHTRGASSISVEPPTLFPLAPPTEVEVELLESDLAWSSQAPAASRPSVDLLESYELVRQLDGTLDLSAPMQGPLRIVLRLPVVSRPPIEIPPIPIARSAVPPAPAPEIKSLTPTPAPTSISEKPNQERRHSPRILTTLPATITVGSATWDGTISNLSLGGTCVTLPGDFPTILPQDAYIVIKTAVGILELHGSAQERSVSLQTKTPTSQLIVTFEPPKREEGAILASLIQAAQEQTLPFCLEVLLAAELQDGLSSSTPLSPEEQEDYDSREAVRVALRLSVRLDVIDPSGGNHCLEALTTNISRDGACLLLSASPELLNGIITLHFAATQTQKHPGAHEPDVPGAALPARMIWSALDPVAPSEFRHQGSTPALQVGLRFQNLTLFAEREVHRVVRQHLMSQGESESSSQETSIVSIPRECRNPRGEAIMITDDHLRQSLAPNTPVIIISPGYGQTALDAMTLSYYLAHHRLRVLRYDHTNHLGLSDGELQQTTLRSMQADLLKVVEFVQHTWPTAPLIVIASDVAARVALKMAVQSCPLELLLLINPVVDIQAMLMTVHGHDLVADHRYGLRRGIANLLGLNVNVDRFVADIVAGHFTDLASTLADLRLLRSPSAILLIPSSPLGPLPPADLPQAFLTALGPHTRLATAPAPLINQDLSLNDQHPQGFKQILDQIAASVSLPTTPVEFRAHTHRMLARQQRIEMERTRLRHNLSQIAREALRVAHLQLPQLGNLHEHWKLLDDLYRLLSPLEPGSMLVDVGVGHGDLVRATMVNQAYRCRQRGWNPEHPFQVIGLEHSHDSLTQARQSLRVLYRELDTDFEGTLTTHPPLRTEWIQADWMQGLPFKDHSIHRIVCNLSLPFVPSPLVMTRELYRILHPHGRLVLTVFHPDTDLSVLYRRHLHRANQDEFGPQAHIVLHYLGRLREAIRHGLLHTFDQSSLASFLQQAGILTPRILPALDGHALFAIIEKGKSAS